MFAPEKLKQSDVNVIPCIGVFCDNAKYTFLEYSTKDNGMISLLTKNLKIINLVSLFLRVLL